jgi:recombination protein RecR
MSIAAFPPAMRKLINELTKLPSVGEKSATRLAYFLITRKSEDTFGLAEAIRVAKEKTRLCKQCFSLSEAELCAICENPNRDCRIICVVEKPADVMAVERSGGYRGMYHVLHGLWSPLRGVGPEKTKINELIARLDRANSDAAIRVEELVMATSTTVEGDATAQYIANSVKHLGVRISRIAQGIPKGGELEYADELTLTHAMQGRRTL